MKNEQIDKAFMELDAALDGAIGMDKDFKEEKMKEIEEIQSLENLIGSIYDIDDEDYDRIMIAIKSIESKIKQLEAENESLTKKMIDLYKLDCSYFLSKEALITLDVAKDIVDSWLDDKEWLELISEGTRAIDYIKNEIDNWDRG